MIRRPPISTRTDTICPYTTPSVLLRIGFATITAYLLGIVGLQFLGGLLLAWVCWKMWTELRSAERTAAHAPTDEQAEPLNVKQKTLPQAAPQIVVADGSMRSDDHTNAPHSKMRNYLAEFIINKI